MAPTPKVKLVHLPFRDGSRTVFHSEVEPAIWWKDGLKCYFLNGVRFDEEMWRKVVRGELSSKEAIAMQSADQRAIALQYIGGEKLMRDFQGKVVGKDKYGEVIELEELKDTDGKPYHYLKAFDPDKGTDVYLRTRPEITSPAEAEAWSYDLQRWKMKYEPSSRT